MRIEFKVRLDILFITVGRTRNREMFKLILIGLQINELGFKDVHRHSGSSLRGGIRHHATLLVAQDDQAIRAETLPTQLR